MKLFLVKVEIDPEFWLLKLSFRSEEACQSYSCVFSSSPHVPKSHRNLLQHPSSACIFLHLESPAGSLGQEREAKRLLAVGAERPALTTTCPILSGRFAVSVHAQETFEEAISLRRDKLEKRAQKELARLFQVPDEDVRELSASRRKLLLLSWLR